MKRALGYLLAWCGATALAVGISWLGVRDVLRNTVMDEPPLAPVVAEEVGGTSRPMPSAVRSSPAERPATPRPSSSAVRRPPSPSPHVSAHPSPRSSPKSQADETLRTFTLKGGRATIAVTAHDCRMVTATPNDGYRLGVWETSTWIRVAFLQEPHESSAFCTWNGTPPRLETYEN
ncbi:hypothetical protein GCM10023194_66040 [Planotetraspora phitsanulokensis]|uniref:Secreted protein n=1 Tax=Planotetraspora phitsanulokensis TaxID=575192 RepID=A0A8J3U554_9ACTN|nr:hypothetical protein [Planotetraspora phitsanulokensis]GII38679.1 hypothetical protein Pph01_36820 [Planotetraspora phitsanulokensis]